MISFFDANTTSLPCYVNIFSDSITKSLISIPPAYSGALLNVSINPLIKLLVSIAAPPKPIETTPDANPFLSGNHLTKFTMGGMYDNPIPIPATNPYPN